jgi:exosome complex component RRP42
MIRAKTIQEQFVMRLAEKGQRADGRKPDEFRKIEIEKDLISNAEGSARVRIGKTDVIVGVKMGVGTPFQDSPDKGILISNAEFSPMASPDFERGRPGEDAIELARVVDRGIRESKAVDVEKLCIEKGEKVWTLFVDSQIMNHDGNLTDAAALGAAIALNRAKMPEYDPKTGDLDITNRKDKLPVKFKPVSVTVSKIAGKLVLDPTLEEENAVSANLTVTTKDDGNICALQKRGEPFTVKEIHQAFDMAVKKGKELRELVS